MLHYFLPFSGSDTLDMGTFQVIMGQHGINDATISEQLFHSFDKNKDGSLSFHEIAVGLSVLLGGSFDDRLVLAFRSYDLDNNGKLPLSIFSLARSCLTRTCVGNG